MKYVVYDLETNGLDYTKDQPIEIGAIAVDNNGTAKQYDYFIKTPELLSEDIKRITGITDEMTAGGVDLKLGIEQLFNILGMYPDGYDEDITIIGHNIIGFDNLFLKKYIDLYNYQMPAKKQFFDTAGAFRAKLLREEKYVYENDYDLQERVLKLGTKGPRYNLSAACQHYGIPLDEATRHRADYDCLCTLRVFEKQAGIKLLPDVLKNSPDQETAIEDQANNKSGQGAFNF